MKNTGNLKFKLRVESLITSNQTIVIIRDNDDESWVSGWADYLLTNYHYTNLNDSFRVNLENKR
jgi:hypothetical protein